MAKSRSITIYVPEDKEQVIERVKQLAEEEMRSFSDMCRMLLKLYLQLEEEMN